MLFATKNNYPSSSAFSIFNYSSLASLWNIFRCFNTIFVIHKRVLISFSSSLSSFFFFVCIIGAAIETDVIEEKGTKSEHVCKYGNQTLNIGDVIKTSDHCLECSCQVPPMPQCVRTITTEKCHWIQSIGRCPFHVNHCKRNWLIHWQKINGLLN